MSTRGSSTTLTARRAETSRAPARMDAEVSACGCSTGSACGGSTASACGGSTASACGGSTASACGGSTASALGRKLALIGLLVAVTAGLLLGAVVDRHEDVLRTPRGMALVADVADLPRYPGGVVVTDRRGLLVPTELLLSAGPGEVSWQRLATSDPVETVAGWYDHALLAAGFRREDEAGGVVVYRRPGRQAVVFFTTVEDKTNILLGAAELSPVARAGER